MLEKRMKHGVNGFVYRQFRRWVEETYGLSVRECILKRINEGGLTHTALAAEFGIDRQRLYRYAKSNGIDLTTQPVAIDVWAQIAAGGVVPGTGTDG